MSSAASGSVSVVGYLALFGGIGIVFVFINLLIGRFVRPHNPHPEKQEIYECGEPTIGSSFVQFDLRFYVVALIFIIFDVEVAFLFPWATVFGKANHLMQDGVAQVQTAGGESAAQGLLQELGMPAATITDSQAVQEGGRLLMQLAVFEVLVFFTILLIGFAYVWRMGALDWVRAITQDYRERSIQPPRADANVPAESILSA